MSTYKSYNINHMPYEIVYIILSQLTTSELNKIRSTSKLFMSIADDISYFRKIKCQPDIDRPISIYKIYEKPPYKFYCIDYNLLRTCSGMGSIAYSN